MKLNPDPALLIKQTFKIPSGDEDKGLGTGKSDAGILFVLSKSWSKFNTYFNAGYSMLDLPKKEKWEDNTAFFGAGFQYPLNAKISLLSEMTYETNFNPNNKDDPLDTTLGMFYTLNENTVLDFALRFGLSDASPDYTLISGVSFSF